MGHAYTHALDGSNMVKMDSDSQRAVLSKARQGTMTVGRFLTSILLFTLISLSGGRCFSESIDTTHWKSAVGAATRNRCQTPATIIEIENVVDQNGKPMEHNVTHMAVRQAGESLLDINLISRKENGEDRTRTFHKNFMAHKADILAELKAGNLFSDRIQHHIKLTDCYLDSKRASYTFTVKIHGVLFNGQAVID